MIIYLFESVILWSCAFANVYSCTSTCVWHIWNMPTFSNASPNISQEQRNDHTLGISWSTVAVVVSSSAQLPAFSFFGSPLLSPDYLIVPIRRKTSQAPCFVCTLHTYTQNEIHTLSPSSSLPPSFLCLRRSTLILPTLPTDIERTINILLPSQNWTPVLLRFSPIRVRTITTSCLSWAAAAVSHMCN